MASKELNCIIIDDEIAVRNRLESLILKFDAINVIAKEGIPEKAIEVILNLKPDIVFIDVEMPRMTGFEVVKQIKNNNYNPTFIFVTGYNQYAIKAIKNEAFDFLLKPVDIEELAQTIQRYKNKHSNNISPSTNLPIFNSLSEREKEILELLFQGLTSKHISERLFISKNTVDTHRRNILEKTRMKSTVELFTLQ